MSDTDTEIGHRQFVACNPDGYLLRLYEPLGVRGCGESTEFQINRLNLIALSAIYF